MTSSLSPDEIRAAAQTHRDLGPEYESAVIESFLDKVGREIDARVDARLAGVRPGQPPMPPAGSAGNGRGSVFALAVITMVLGIPLTAITYQPSGGNAVVGLVWLCLLLINVVYAVTSRPRSGR